MLAAVSTLALSTASASADSDSGAVQAFGPTDRRSVSLTATAPEHQRAGASAHTQVVSARCPSAHRAIRFYARRLNEHRAQTGAVKVQVRRHRSGSCPRYVAHVLQRKARAWRLRAEAWVEARTLRDFTVRPGVSAWRHAVDEVQRAYPGTRSWLLSCSASEGGWGRFVWNSQGSGCGGWMQYQPSTFVGFFARAELDVRRRGFRVPRSASSLYSTLGQALAGAWAYRNGLTHHWFGHGC